MQEQNVITNALKTLIGQTVVVKFLDDTHLVTGELRLTGASTATIRDDLFAVEVDIDDIKSVTVRTGFHPYIRLTEVKP